MPAQQHRHRGRQPHVPGGHPFPLEIRLTETDRLRLAGAVHRGLAAEFDTVPADWREVLAAQLRHRTAVAELRGDVAAVGRLLNQIARAVNSGGHPPSAEMLARLGARVEEVLAAAEEGLAELDALTATARVRL